MTRWITRLAAAAALATCATAAQAADTIRLAVTDIVGLEMLQTEFGAFRDTLAEATGHDIEFLPVNSRTAAVEALNAEKVDFVLTGPAEYVVINKRTNATPVVGFSRPDYFSGIIVMADSDYNVPADLMGQKVAFGDVGSTSNHLAPAHVLADYGIMPDDVEVVHTSRNIAWESLKRGDIAAVGMNYGKFLGIRANETAFEPGAFKVIGRGPDLPNDLLVAGAHVDPATVEILRTAFVEHSDDLVAAILVGEDNQKYSGMKFIADVDDSDYDYVRAAYATIGYPEYAEFVGN